MSATAVAIHAPPVAGRGAIMAELCGVVAGGSRFGRFMPVRPQRYEQVSADELAHLTPGVVPVVHTTRVAALDALTETARWLRVLLWVPRGVARRRCAELPDGDERMSEWEAAYLDLAANPEATWAVALRTDLVDARRAAEIIRAAVAEDRQPEMRTAVLHGFLFK